MYDSNKGLLGFECLVHMGEETKNPRVVIPHGLLWSILANGIVGLVMLITIVVSLDASYLSPEALTACENQLCAENSCC